MMIEGKNELFEENPYNNISTLKNYLCNKNKNTNLSTSNTNSNKNLHLIGNNQDNLNDYEKRKEDNNEINNNNKRNTEEYSKEKILTNPKEKIETENIEEETLSKDNDDFNNIRAELIHRVNTQRYNSVNNNNLFSNNFYPKYSTRIKRKIKSEIDEETEFYDLKFNYQSKQKISSRFDRRFKSNLFDFKK